MIAKAKEKKIKEEDEVKLTKFRMMYSKVERGMVCTSGALKFNKGKYGFIQLKLEEMLVCHEANGVHYYNSELKPIKKVMNLCIDTLKFRHPLNSRGYVLYEYDEDYELQCRPIKTK